MGSVLHGWGDWWLVLGIDGVMNIMGTPKVGMGLKMFE